LRDYERSFQPDNSAVTVIAMARGNTFTHNAAAGVSSYVQHFCTGICLLVIICYSNRVKFAG
jgi:hypothetical protein